MPRVDDQDPWRSAEREDSGDLQQRKAKPNRPDRLSNEYEVKAVSAAGLGGAGVRCGGTHLSSRLGFARSRKRRAATRCTRLYPPLPSDSQLLAADETEGRRVDRVHRRRWNVSGDPQWAPP